MRTLLPIGTLGQIQCALLFLLGPVSIVSPHGVVWILILSAILGILHHGLLIPRITLYRYGFTGALLEFVFYVIVFGSIFGEYGSIKSALKLAGILLLCIHTFVFFRAFSQEQAQRLLVWYCSGIAIALVFLTVDVLLGNPWQSYKGVTAAKAFAHTSQILALSYWPIAVYIAKSGLSDKLRIALIVMSFVIWGCVLRIIDCDAGLVSLTFGFLGAIVAFRAPTISYKLLRVIFPVSVLVAPLVALWAFTPENIAIINKYMHTDSYIHRLHIWHTVASQWLNAPVFGFGMDSTRILADVLGDQTWSMVDASGNLRTYTVQRIALHPHNMALQLYLELGLFGVISFLWVMDVFFKRINQSLTNPLDRAFAMGTFLTAMVIAWVSVGIWQSWWLSSLFINCALTGMLLKGSLAKGANSV